MHNWQAILDSLFRWAHVVAGILWIGLLYFFNWVNGPFAKTMDGPTKKAVVPELMPRALFWFRWGAAWTWITGVVLLLLQFYHVKLNMFDGSRFESDAAVSWSVIPIVLVAFTFLSVHVYDVVVKKVLTTGPMHFWGGVVWATAWVYLVTEVGRFGMRSAMIHLGAMFGTWMAFNVWFRIWPAQKRIITATKNGQAPDPADPALAGLRSKHNTYMSIPLVFMMLNQHSAPLLASHTWANGAVVLIGWAMCYVLYGKSAKVQGF